MIRSILCTAATAAALLCAAGAAHASDARLTFGDLDLTRPEQARILKQRIADSASRRCSDETETGTRLHAGCEEVTRDALVEALPAATRTAYLAALKQPVPKQMAAK